MCYVSVQGQMLNNSESFNKNRDRVWETLSNLPIEKSDWRFDDLRKNYLDNWQKEIYRTKIYFVSEIKDYNTPAIYYLPESEGDTARIELIASKFTVVDDQNRCVEHELTHAAFKGNMNVPGWLAYLGNYTAKQAGTESTLPFERIVIAATVRRDILDYYKLPLNAAISFEQLQNYVDCTIENMDFGLKWLVETTKADKLLPLLNFENGYFINEKKFSPPIVVKVPNSIIY